MKKKKLSLKGLEVKSFVTNLDGNLSHTVKGGNGGDDSGIPQCDVDTNHSGCGYTDDGYTVCYGCTTKSQDPEYCSGGVTIIQSYRGCDTVNKC